MKRNFSTNDIKESLENEIKNIYINEFNDLFSNILKYTSGKFLSYLCKRVKLTIDSKFNEPQAKPIITKIENYIIEEYYNSQYKIAKDNLNLIKDEPTSLRKNYIFNGQNFIKHCSLCENALHTCGKKFYSNESFIKNSNDLMLICIECNKVYKYDMIKMNCDKCHDDYYTKFNNNKNNKYQPATWSKYHCNIVINDKIKCHYCHDCLFIDPAIPNILKCFKCKYLTEVSKLKFKCLLCKKEFSSEAKVYNPLEFKMIKMSVKDTLINKIKAIPNNDKNNCEIDFKCNCKIDYNKCKFYHKRNCRGILLKGKMNKKDIIVCSNCHSLNYYENYVWMCPVCENRTGINNKNKINEKGRLSNRTPNKTERKRERSIIYNSGQKNYDCYVNDNDFIEKKVTCKKINIDYGIERKKSNECLNKIPKPKNRNSSQKNIFYSENKENNKNQVNIKVIQNIVNNDNNNEIIRMVKQQLITKFDDEIQDIQKSKNNKKTKISPPKKVQFSNSPDIPEKEIEKMNNKINNNINDDPNLKSQNAIQTIRKKDYTFNIDEYEIKEKIGEGSFGQIYKVLKDNKYYALKKLIGTNEYDFEALQHENDILRSISSSKNLSVINIYGMQSKKLDKTTKVLYILMELAESDWEKEIRKKFLKKEYYKENELISIIKILIKSFSELQKEKISHRDIKPQNILICKNHTFKIADFGEAKELQRKGKITRIQTIRGTEIYMSPLLYSAIQIERDAIETKHNTYKSDVFSLGLCLLYAATLNFNLLIEIRNIFDMKILEKIVRKIIGNRYSEKLILLILNMIEVNEDKRMDFIELENYLVKNVLE